MTPVISINTLCLEPASMAVHVETVARLQAPAISPGLEDIEPGSEGQVTRLLRDAGLGVGTLTHRAFGFETAAIAAMQRERLNRTIDIAHAIGSPSICMTTGGRAGLPWPVAAARFAEEIAPCVAYARTAGVALGIEPTSHLYADASLAHRLSDIVTLAQSAGTSVGMDLFACWVDSDIDAAIAVAGPMCAFVQVSDYVYGDRGLPCRAVPGDGAMPLDHLVRQILATGFCGPFDIEVIGPRLWDEGRETGLRRAMARLGEAIRNGMPADGPDQ